MKILHLFFSVVFFNVLFAQKITVVGAVIDQTSKSAVPYAQIVDYKNNTGTIANEQGRFSYTVNVGDTLHIISVGYEKTRIVISDKNTTVIVYLKQNIQQLKGLTIHAIPQTIDELRRAIVEMGEQGKINVQVPPVERKAGEVDNAGLKAIQSPITFLYNMFSKKGAQAEEIQELTEQKKRVQEKYNPQLVSKITGITETKELAQFITYCGFTDKYILQSSPYDLAIDISNQYEKFKLGK